MKAQNFERRLCVSLPFLALLAACGGGRDEGNAANAAPANAASSVAPEEAGIASLNESAKPASANAVKIAEKSEVLEFSYAWPAEAAAIAPLDSWLRGNAATLRQKALGPAKGDQASAKKDGYPYRTHSYEESFNLVANTPAVLILQSEGYIYTGGAHGMPIATDIIWDKAAGTRLATRDLLDVPAFARVAKADYCKELDRQREKKRGAPVKPDPDEISDFVSCVAMTDQDILPISKGGKALDTVRILIAPYNAGPYAEGSYVIDLPMTAATLATVKPAWKSAFAVR
jgi:hypothetical protein